MRRAFTLLEMLLALALTAMAAGAAVSFLMPLLRDVPAIAADIESRSRAERTLDRIAQDLLVEHESMPRRRAMVENGVLTIVTRAEGHRVACQYSAERLGVDGFGAKLLDSDRTLLVRVTDGDGVFTREFRLP